MWTICVWFLSLIMKTNPAQEIPSCVMRGRWRYHELHIENLLIYINHMSCIKALTDAAHWPCGDGSMIWVMPPSPCEAAPTVTSDPLQLCRLWDLIGFELAPGSESADMLLIWDSWVCFFTAGFQSWGLNNQRGTGAYHTHPQLFYFALAFILIPPRPTEAGDTNMSTDVLLNYQSYIIVFTYLH